MINQFTNYDFPLWGYFKLPEINISSEEKRKIGAKEDCSNLDYLILLVKEGFKNVLLYNQNIRDNPEVYVDRIKKELDTFENLSFVNYILLVYKICKFCDDNGIFRDYGRGSCVSSTVFYCLGVTYIDPIKYGLFFERFVSAVRAEKKIVDNEVYVYGGLLADVDIDVEPSKRYLVIEYLNKLYPNRICRISNLSELSSKILIKETGKVVKEYSEQEMKNVSDMIPKIFGINSEIIEARKENKNFDLWCEKNDEVFKIALKLQNLFKHFSVHASGYVVASKELDQVLPTYFNADREITSSYTMHHVSSCAVKLDLLGSSCSTIVKKTCDLAKIDWKQINVDNDPLIYDTLQRDDIQPMGLFQIAAHTNLKVTKLVKPKNLSELANVIAIARPGGLSFLDKFCADKEEKVHPLFDPILAQTRYVCLFQETMMQLATTIGFTLLEAEKLRKIVGKKLVDQVQEWKEKIYNKCEENNIDKECGDLLWKILEASAKYSFNKAHALGFGALSALTVYLKYKYPQEFFLSLLQESKNAQEPLEEITKIQNELKFFNIELLPPHLLKSDFDFKIEGKDIRFGLSSIKSVSDKTIEKLIGFRKPHANKFELFEAANACKIPIDVLSALVQAGAMEEKSYGMTRSRLVLEANLWNILTPNEKVHCHEWAAQNDFNYDLIKIIVFLKDNNNEKGKPFIKASRFETIKKNYAPAKEIYKINSTSERLANFFFERRAIGYSYSEKLYDIFKDSSEDLISIGEVNESPKGDYVTFVGAVDEYTTWTSKEKKTKCFKIILNDESSSISCMAFNDRILDIKENGMPQRDEVVVIRGTKKDGTVFIDNLAVQTYKIYTKYSQLKRDKKVEITE